jgi:tol-pal system protein YbgF
MRKLILLGVCFLSSLQFAHAAIFDDKEARQQIIDLQQKTDAQNQSALSAISALEKRVLVLENVIKSQGLMDLLSQVEQLNKEIRHLKGNLEIAQHQIEVTQQRQKELYTDADGRLRKLETAPPVTQAPLATSVTQPIAPNHASSIDAAENEALTAAQTLLNESKFKAAFEAFNKFVKDYPNSPLSPEAFYGLGSAQFSLKYFKAALITQQKLVAQFPESARLPEAKYSIANCQIQLAQIDAAKATLRELIAQFPEHQIIPNAKRRLEVLDSLKK